MNKELKDYIHYYIGQTCTYDDPYYNNYGLGGVVTEKIIMFVRAPHLSGAVTNVKPHLRRLEDMTEEEMKEVFKIVFGRPFYEGGDIRFHEASNTTPSKRWVLRAEVDRVGIQWDGKIWADSDMVSVYINPYLITHYLLKCGFDLFGLIDSGAAIDSKTLQPQQQ